MGIERSRNIKEIKKAMADFSKKRYKDPRKKNTVKYDACHSAQRRNTRAKAEQT